jgi:P2 family phage contractile tail tube protein|nr:MAG TPA: tail tube protein [Caudoviricetes sp.]
MVPEKLINFRVYQDGDDLLGISDVTLPKLDSITETVKGAGVAGEIDDPTIGHFGSMELELNWRSLVKSNIVLAKPTGVHLDLRGACQGHDSAKNVLKTMPVKIVVEGTPKSTDLGKLDMGATTDTKNTIEVTYIKITVDGETVLEIDKFNYICVIGGVDYMADIRDALGL